MNRANNRLFPSEHTLSVFKTTIMKQKHKHSSNGHIADNWAIIAALFVIMAILATLATIGAVHLLKFLL